MLTKQRYKFNDLKFMIIGSPILGMLIPSVFFNAPFENTYLFWKRAFLATIYTVVFWSTGLYFFNRGNKKYPHFKDNKKRILWILSFYVFFIFISCNVLYFFTQYLGLENSMPSLIQMNAVSFVCFLTIAVIYESIRYWELWEYALIEKKQLEKENLVSQLEGLRRQVNPHFLFNSLNTLIQIIPEDASKADRFVRQLSKVYRYILEIKDSSITSLNNELEFLNAYIFLLKERFGDNLQVNLSDNIFNTNYQIVPLALQIVLENAIKHNIISTEKPLNIQIFIEKEQYLIVRNNLQRKNQEQEGTGTGLKNIENRYNLISGKSIDVIMTPQYFTVILPLLESNDLLLRDITISNG